MGPLKKKLLSGGLWVLSAKVVMMLVGLVTNAILARLLTPEEFGAFFLVLSIVSLSAIIAQFGLARAIVRFVAESIANNNSARAKAAIIISFRIISFVALLVALIIYVGAGAWIAIQVFESSAMLAVVGMICLMVLIVPINNFIMECFRGLHDISWATIFGGLISSILSALMLAVIWLVLGEARLYQIIAVLIIANGVNMLVAGYFLFTKVNKFDPAFGLGINELMAVSIPILVTNITYFILTQSGFWIIGIFLDKDQVALYGVAVKLMFFVTMPLMLVNMVVPSYVAALHVAEQKIRMEKMIRTAATMAAVPAASMLLILFVFGESVLSVIYGEFYMAAYAVVLVLAAGQFMNVIAGSCGIVMMMTGHQLNLMIMTMLSGVLTVLLSLLLVDDYGVIGVAAASSIGMAMQNFLMLFYVKKKIGVWTHIGFQYFGLIGNVIKS